MIASSRCRLARILSVREFDDTAQTNRQKVLRLRPLYLRSDDHGKAEILIAGVEADVPIHFQIHVALLRVAVHRAGIGDVLLIGVEILQGQRPAAGCPSLEGYFCLRANRQRAVPWHS